MTDEEKARLAAALQSARQERGWTVREVARRAGVDVGVVSKLERELVNQPRHETVRAIAAVLGIPLGDIYALLHWLPADELPTLKPYMRAKYGELTDAELAEVERFVGSLTQKHGRGPADHEDEQ